MNNKPISVLLSAADQAELARMYSCFIQRRDQGRVFVGAIVNTLNLLEHSLHWPGLEVAIIDADLLSEPGERRLLDFLKTHLNGMAAVILISPRQENRQEAIQKIRTVREVFTKPVDCDQLFECVYEIGISERTVAPVVLPISPEITPALVQRGGG